MMEQISQFDMSKIEKVICTGHSLGAALATVMASRIDAEELYTFGSPRVGTRSFIKEMTADGIVERRIPSTMLLQYEEAEGPTKVDLGDIDHLVVEREADKGYLEGKAKFHGWTNPLGWRDDGTDDDTVM